MKDECEKIALQATDRWDQVSATQIANLSRMAIDNIEDAIEGELKPGSYEYEAFNSRFEAYHVAIGDRISLVEIKLGREPSPK